MNTAHVTLDGVLLLCKYEYLPGAPQTRDEPEEREAAELVAVFAGGVEITLLLSTKQLAQLEKLALAEHRGEMELEQVRRAEERTEYA